MQHIILYNEHNKAVITSAKEVMCASTFVCLLAELHITTRLIFTKFCGKAALRPRNKQIFVVIQIR